jgi:flagellar basal body rod protein FlgF
VKGSPSARIFKVGSSEIIRDPSTGETLDVAFTEKGRIKVQTGQGEGGHLRDHRG